MSFDKLYVNAKKGNDIFDAFKKYGVETRYRAMILLNLHEPKAVSRQKLRELIGMKNEGQFTSSVLNPLKEYGYIEMSTEEQGSVSITSTGEGLVDCIMDDLGY